MENKYIVFLNGNYSDDINKIKSYIEDRTIIAVDGGANFCYNNNILPDLLVGDFDSINKEVLEKFSNIKMYKSTPDKDYLDFELALIYINDNNTIDVKNRFKKSLDKKVYNNDIIVFGATGKRVDMTLSNLKLLHNYNNMIFITEDFMKIKYLKFNSNIVEFNDKFGNFSIIPITDLDALELKGFEYTLDGVDIPKNIGLSSNIALGKCSIKCSGEMYIIYE